MYRSLVLLVLCFTTRLFGAFELQSQGGRSVAMGSGGVAAVRDGWAAFTNPGLISTIPFRSLSLQYTPQQFGLSELARGAFSYVEPTGSGTFALSGTRFGFQLYREVAFRLAYGTEITSVLSVGGSFDYYHLSIERYGSDVAFGVDIGMSIAVTEDLHWGFVAFNINAPSIGQANEKLPQIFSTGVSYEPLPGAAVVVDIIKEIRFPAELHLGIEYTLLDLIALRGGTSSDPSLLCAGLGIHYGFIHLDYAFTNHVDLGMTHQFSLSIDLGDM